jgi:DNA invertase Pin-like site-specific DNA recombinase
MCPLKGNPTIKPHPVQLRKEVEPMARENTQKETSVAIYARVSTSNKGQDVDLQLRDLRAYAGARGMTISGEYVDNGVSGRKDRRPELDRLMSDARKRKFDAVMVWRFDRFARSTKHLVLALEEFKHLGIDFISYKENIDTSSPMGKAMFTIASAFGGLEADLIKERVVAGLANARAKGKTLGRPSTKVDVEQLSQLRSEGLSIRAIATRMNVDKMSVCKTLKSCGEFC